jgi:hypothetical protein
VTTTDHTDLLEVVDVHLKWLHRPNPKPDQHPVDNHQSAGYLERLAAALRAETERAAMAARMADAAVNRTAAIAAVAREVIAWWDDDTRGGSAEVDALRALVAPDRSDDESATPQAELLAGAEETTGA